LVRERQTAGDRGAQSHGSEAIRARIAGLLKDIMESLSRWRRVFLYKEMRYLNIS
jgi:hypothetical protein